MDKSICNICALIWGIFCISGAAYITFVLGRSGWWILAGVIVASFWSCSTNESE